jgi:hypothetical protein
MELKNAVAVCLIALVSATLVVLVARSLDNQAASQLEPQLSQIVEELRAIRTGGGIPTAASPARSAETLEDALVVYYFHGDIRCPTCRAIESQTHDTVQNDFGTQLQSGKLAWKVLNYEKPDAAGLAKKFDIHMANVVLAQVEGGAIGTWRRLDEVWALVGDQPAFAQFIRSEIEQMLQEKSASGETTERTIRSESPAADLSALPLPESEAPVDVPLPE